MPVVSIAFCQCCQQTFQRTRGFNGHTLCETCRPKFLGLGGVKLRNAITRHRSANAPKPTLVDPVVLAAERAALDDEPYSDAERAQVERRKASARAGNVIGAKEAKS